MSKGRLGAALKVARFAMAEGTPGRGMGWPASGATPEMLAIINAMPQVNATLTEQDVFVRMMDACNDQPMWNGMQIEPAGLGFVAAQAKGVPVLCNHDMGWASGRAALPVGRLFGGQMVEENGARWARLPFWMPANEDGCKLAQGIDSGQISEVSVHIGFDMAECSICQTDLMDCAHVPLEVYDGKTCIGTIRGVSDLFEVSLVWAGMAKGTRLFMAAGRHEIGSGDDFMKLLAARKDAPRARLFKRESARLLLR